MPALSLKYNLLTSTLIALMVGFISPLSHAEKRPPWVGETLEGEECYGKSIGFGPYDYQMRAKFPAELEVVENAHFSPSIEKLETSTSSSAIDDIAYTIMAWPNHHRALHSAMKYRMIHWEWPKDAKSPPAECQLQRAIDYSPKDPIPYIMYGLLLHKAEQYERALLAYRAANSLKPNDILTQYNMGLTLVELEQYDEAEEVAKTVYAAGMPLPGLRNKLLAADRAKANLKAPAADTDAPKIEVQSTQEVPVTENP